MASADGNSFFQGTLSLGGASAYGITDYGFEVNGDVVLTRSDTHKYGRQCGSTNHDARISFTTIDLNVFTQSAAATPTVGSSVGTGGAVLTALLGIATSKNFIVTLNPAVWVSWTARGSHTDPFRADGVVQAAGSGATEPTVTVLSAV